MRCRSNAGFPLAELLVATLLATLVMSGVYFSFNSSIRLWRNGERDLQTYQDARTSMTGGHTSIAPDQQQDELGSVVFAFNDQVNELQQRKARIDDLDAAVRRSVQATEEEVLEPLGALERLAGSVALDRSADGTARVLEQAHDLRAHVANLAAAARSNSGAAGLARFAKISGASVL